MYTELALNVTLRPDTPAEVIAVLQYMAGIGDEPAVKPGHEFFDASRWPVLFICGSAYFDNLQGRPLMERDEYTGNWQLRSWANLKNYDGEIEKFADWIAPYVATDHPAGWQRHEEAFSPTILLFHSGRAHWLFSKQLDESVEQLMWPTPAPN